MPSFNAPNLLKAAAVAFSFIICAPVTAQKKNDKDVIYVSKTTMKGFKDVEEEPVTESVGKKIDRYGDAIRDAIIATLPNLGTYQVLSSPFEISEMSKDREARGDQPQEGLYFHPVFSKINNSFVIDIRMVRYPDYITIRSNSKELGKLNPPTSDPLFNFDESELLKLTKQSTEELGKYIEPIKWKTKLEYSVTELISDYGADRDWVKKMEDKIKFRIGMDMTRLEYPGLDYPYEEGKLAPVEGTIRIILKTPGNEQRYNLTLERRNVFGFDSFNRAIERQISNKLPEIIQRFNVPN